MQGIGGSAFIFPVQGGPKPSISQTGTCCCCWLLSLYSAILCFQADFLHSHVILNEWLAFKIHVFGYPLKWCTYSAVSDLTFHVLPCSDQKLQAKRKHREGVTGQKSKAGRKVENGAGVTVTRFQVEEVLDFPPALLVFLFIFLPVKLSTESCSPYRLCI